ncbi:MAG: GNAT family N-acetyltransferase [Acidimicrobiia bacterium]|nr:GNAT family N-acetyltransferase [Acidimicrobiia bacterium]
MRVRGEWPNPVALRKGWYRATARPWNRSRPDAHLRLIRGSVGFLTEVTDLVLGFGATSVVSPPLLGGTQTVWRTAGFGSYTTLRLLRKALDGLEEHHAAVRQLGDAAWARVVAIDAAAFGDMWKAELPALVEALRSTSTSTLLGVDDPATGSLAGYAIVACSGSTGYLQRIGVHPNLQGLGLGRSLTRAAHNWSLQRGARTVILNTKPDNAAALALYESEGYTVMPDRLELLRYPPATDR